MNDMEMMMGPTVLGFPLVVALMVIAGVFYVICAVLIWKPFREEKNELLGALMAFLLYQAVNMFFMGLGIYKMNIVFENIASLAVFIGSVYMLKFPFSSFAARTRKILFNLTLVIVLGVYIWFVINPERNMSLVNFATWYDIVINGIVVGCFMIIIGLRTTQSWLRIKAVGGGSGVVSCCVVSNVAMLGGAVVFGSIFQFLAPVVIVISILIGRRKQYEIVEGGAMAM